MKTTSQEEVLKGKNFIGKEDNLIGRGRKPHRKGRQPHRQRKTNSQEDKKTGRLFRTKKQTQMNYNLMMMTSHEGNIALSYIAKSIMYM